MTASSSIPVADDASFFSKKGGTAENSLKPSISPSIWITLLFSGMVICAIVVFFNTFASAGDQVLKLLIASRYILWPTVLLCFFITTYRFGASLIWKSLSLFLPFLLFGIFSAIAGYDPIGSTRLIILFVLALMGASSAGLELGSLKSARLISWTMFIILAVSVLVVKFFPAIGTVTDLRTENGAWRGILYDKTLFGLMCVYGTVFALLANTERMIIRFVMVMVAFYCVIHSDSQGNVVAVAAALGYVTLVFILRKSEFSLKLQSLILSFSVVIGVACMVVGFEVLLALLGRDTSLTGRTDIWSAFFARATQFWPTGAGPGTFIDTSFVTVDLVARFAYLGNITSPHDLYIAVFGEVGIFGFIAFIIPLIYCAFIVPFLNKSIESLAVGTVTFTMMTAGLVETHDVFGANVGIFLLIIAYSAFQKERASEQEPDPSLDPELAFYRPT